MIKPEFGSKPSPPRISSRKNPLSRGISFVVIIRNVIGSRRSAENHIMFQPVPTSL